MKYLNRLSYFLLFFAFSVKSMGQMQNPDQYKIDFYNGYYVEMIFAKHGCWPLYLSALVDTCDFVDTCKVLTVKEAVNYFVNNSYIVPERIFSDQIMFEQLCGKLDQKLLDNIYKYKDNYARQYDYYSIEGHCNMNEGYVFIYVYSKYSGIIFVPLKDNVLYNSSVSESIDFEEYPNRKVAIPIYSGFVQGE